MPDGEISVGELARQVREVFARLETVTRRLEDGQFVRTDIFSRYEKATEEHLEGKASKSELDSLKAQVKQLEEDKTWLVRLVLGFIILGILGAIFVASGGVK